MSIPEVEIGDIVLFKGSPSDTVWSPAMVIATGPSLFLHVFIKSLEYNNALILAKCQCYHVDDPIWKDPERANPVLNWGRGGCWSLTARDIRINKMLAAFDASAKEAKKAKTAPQKRGEKPAQETVEV